VGNSWSQARTKKKQKREYLHAAEGKRKESSEVSERPQGDGKNSLKKLENFYFRGVVREKKGYKKGNR